MLLRNSGENPAFPAVEMETARLNQTRNQSLVILLDSVYSSRLLRLFMIGGEQVCLD